MLMKEIHEDLNKWRDIPCLWIRQLDTVKMSILPTLNRNSDQNLSKSFRKKGGENIWNLRLGKETLDLTPKARSIKKKKKKKNWTSSKLKHVKKAEKTSFRLEEIICKLTNV